MVMDGDGRRETGEEIAQLGNGEGEEDRIEAPVSNDVEVRDDDGTREHGEDPPKIAKFKMGLLKRQKAYVLDDENEEDRTEEPASKEGINDGADDKDLGAQQRRRCNATPLERFQ